MKRCRSCFTYAVSQPLHCSRCRRSYDNRICANGHINSRSARRCQLCGSTHLSTAANVGGRLDTLAAATVRIALATSVVVLAATVLIGCVTVLDWNALTPHLVLLMAMPWILYRATLFLPGPITVVSTPNTSVAVDF